MNVTDIALATINAEHRALSAVLHTFQELLGKVASGYGAPDFGLFSAMLYYIDDFQGRCHHPKEEEYIFTSLRAATSDCDGIVSELQAAHVKGAQAVARLHRCLVFYQGGMPGGIGMLKAGVDDYVAHMHEHMSCEEALFERSRAVIVEQDWARIAAAFDENDDPLFGSNRREQFGRLYQRILVLAPHKLKQGLFPATRF
jgi:hemerythrin-like domain-containing protein